MADQCIVCLENLDVQSPPLPQSPPDSADNDLSHHPSSPGLASASTTAATDSAVPRLSICNGTNSTQQHHHDDADDDNADDDDDVDENSDNTIAVIQVCGHVLHNACLKEWTGKANSCPICRQSFHLVHVYNKIGGTKLSSYKVEEKKQVAEFDPQQWLDENPEQIEASRPCPICDLADHEEVLLLCDSCDAPYHTYCVGLPSVPRGHWFCMECSETAADLLAEELGDPDVVAAGLAGLSDGHSDYLPRTQATMRRARQRARSDEWQGAWGQIAGRVYDALNLDLDNYDDDDALSNYRRSQQRRQQERQAYQRWQRRVHIAAENGAGDVFANNISDVLPGRLAPRHAVPSPPQESPEERQAWGDLERAMEVETPARPAPNHRKRKSRSVTASPVEPPPQPERKLKRPRTRRVPVQSVAASSSTPAPARPVRNGPPAIALGVANSPTQNSDEPTFLSSLLREVEMSTPSDDETIRALFPLNKPAADPSSPATSPSPSAHSSPRALSTTPPPRGINDRPGSPLSLSSWIEPVYPPANYGANTSGGEQSDSESRPRQPRRQHNAHIPEIRQPRPRRHQSPNMSANLVRSQEASPVRAPALSLEMKETISGIVKDALKPHWKSRQLTADQYSSINRDLSHKLYKEVRDPALDEDSRDRFEKIATREVARAVAELKP
ncbi:hypothetical protein GGR56DRAFT_254774 [Xylariaceae sp. FL0804]|nr:hypothetical protein GGR56DRAFT_254774 [Xylariaceae sp. FL0804]